MLDKQDFAPRLGELQFPWCMEQPFLKKAALACCVHQASRAVDWQDCAGIVSVGAMMGVSSAAKPLSFAIISLAICA
jgi:hypothetical protein